MSEKMFDLRSRFLLKNGKRVHQVKEVNVGDILGTVSLKDDHIGLNYVDRVFLEPNFLKFNYFPYAKLKGPYFSLGISKDLEPTGYSSLYLDPQYSIGRIWRPLVISDELSKENQEKQKGFLLEIEEDKEFGEAFKDDKDVYVMNKGIYTDLGNLIPSVELPSLTFFPQSRDLDKLVTMVKDSAEDIQALREISKRLEQTYKRFI